MPTLGGVMAADLKVKRVVDKLSIIERCGTSVSMARSRAGLIRR
jgi:hypothetical protein